MTNHLQATEAWLESESPDQDEIRTAIDNLSHIFVSKPPSERPGVHAAIMRLTKELADPDTVVILPSTGDLAPEPSATPVNYCLAEESDQPALVAVSPSERRALFEALKRDIRPF